MRMGVKIRNSIGRQEEDRISHMICTDNCYLFAESKEQIIKMIENATEELKRKGLDWKEDERELISWGFYEEMGDIHLEDGSKKYVIKEVAALQAMGALISKEADSMSTLKFRMNKADSALWLDMKFYENNGIAEGRKHKRYREVAQSCILHSCESWSWNKEVEDTLHAGESRKLDLSLRRWAETGLSLEWFWANQIRKARKRFAEGGEENIEYLVLQRIWSYKEKTFDKKRNKMTDKMMRSILTHANPEWREQRSICARIVDPQNQDRIKRRRAGVVHTNWDNLMMNWTGGQRW